MKNLFFIFSCILANFSIQACQAPAVCDISGLDKKEVLKALYKEAKNPDNEMLKKQYPTLSDKECEDEFEIAWKYNNNVIDWIYGRELKVNLTGSHFSTFFYNLYNGENKAERVIAALRLEEDRINTAKQIEEDKKKAANMLKRSSQRRMCRGAILEALREAK